MSRNFIPLRLASQGLEYAILSLLPDENPSLRPFKSIPLSLLLESKGLTGSLIDLTY